jgi:hypothetical protein
MTIRRLNYTGRKRLSRADLSITLYERPSGPAAFDIDLSALPRYELPADALVFVEARLRTRWMRFAFGSVGALASPADRRLTEFDSTDGVLFSVKVTSASGRPGLMLAEAERIPVRRPGEGDERRTPLLPVKPDDIGNEVYRVDFSGPAPTLLLNRAAGDKDTLARSPLFMSLVYPAVFREILNRIVYVEGLADADDDGDSWESRWLTFAQSLPGVGAVPEAEESESLDHWIDGAVASFAKAQNMLDRFTAGWVKGGA